MDKRYLLFLSLFSVLFLFFNSAMSPLYPTNDWADVNTYFNVGKAMMNGHTLYSEAFDHKGPLIFVVYGIGYLICNSSFFGVFLLQIIAWVIMLYNVFRTANLFISKAFSFITACLFPLAIIQYSHTGGSAEEFILVLSTISLYYFVKFFKEDNKTHSHKVMFLHGVLSCMAFFTKLNLVMFWVFPVIGIFITIITNKESKNLGKNILYFVGGLFSVAIPLLLYFLINESLQTAYDVYITLNSRYAEMHGLAFTLELTYYRTFDFVAHNFLTALLTFVGAIYFPIRHIKNRIGMISLILTFLSFYFVIFCTRTFHGLYYPLSIYVFTILGFISLFHFVSRYISVVFNNFMFGLLAIAIIITGLYHSNMFGYTYNELKRNETPKHVNFHFADIIKKKENPTFLNLGFGYGNNVFTLCNIVPKQTYFLTPNIYHPMYPAIRDSQTQYIINKEIEFILLDSGGFNYEYFKDLPVLMDNYQIIESYIVNNSSTYYLYQRR